MKQWAAIGVVLWCSVGCGSAAVENPPTRIRVAAPSSAVGEELARLYNAKIPEILASAEAPETSRFNLRALQQGAVEVGVVRADLTYAAFRRGTPLHPEPHNRLRGIAVMGMSLLHVITDAQRSVRTLGDLRGQAVGLVSVSPDATQRMGREGDFVFFRDLLAATGEIKTGDIRTVPLPPGEFIQALQAGELAAGLLMAPHPSPAPLPGTIRAHAMLRLLEISPQAAARVRTAYPFYKPAVVAAGTYNGQETPVRTVGVDVLLVCRDDLAEDVVYALVRTLFESADRVQRSSELAATLDPVLAPATPIALHPGAARYYRERELPGF